MYNSQKMNRALLFDILRYGYLFSFTGLQTVLLLGVFLEWFRDRRSARIPCPRHVKVSVIIPIRNESGRMRGLLRSLLIQDYPAEIIFVDDCSADNSPAMLAEFVRDARGKGLDNCRIITLKENPGPNNKQYALGRGIEEATGDFLLFTDGDCVVPQGWIRAMASRIADGRTGAIIGPVYKSRDRKGFFSLYQCFDHEVRFAYLAAAAGLGAAGGGFGNNIIINRKALDESGGYEAVPPSPTEDAALISQIRSHGKYRIRAAILQDAAVKTASENSWKTLINQTLRWNNGGIFSPDIITRFNYNFLMLLIAAGIFVIPFLPFFPGLWPGPLGIYFALFENFIAATLIFHAKRPRGAAVLGYFFCVLFIPFYFTLMTFMGYFRIKVKWKEKTVK